MHQLQSLSQLIVVGIYSIERLRILILEDKWLKRAGWLSELVGDDSLINTSFLLPLGVFS